MNAVAFQRIAIPLLGVMLALNSLCLWFGLTLDAASIGTTVRRDILGFQITLLDERATYSILSAIFQLRADGNQFLFLLLFTFSVVFPILKLLASWGLYLALLGKHRREIIGHWASWLHHLGKWSMLDVFALALLAVLFKLNDVARLKVESGIFWFGGAVACGIAVSMGIGWCSRRLVAAGPTGESRTEER